MIEVSLIGSLEAIPAAEWDACACPETEDGGPPFDPFTTHRFLKALEDSGSVGGRSGWQPRYMLVRHGGRTVACAPLYAKSHSQGEYIFDHNWAHAYERAGGDYYPKLQIAVPFTPATGRRFLTRPGWEEAGTEALIQGARQVAANHGLSSVHATFCTAEEAERAGRFGMMHRVSQQFHWENGGYADFDGFLASLSSRKRKNIRKERATAQAFGGEILRLTGDQIEPRHWDAVWAFYQDTGSRKWGTPYLTRDFFAQAHAHLRGDTLLVLALRNGRPVAGALNFLGRETLFGRYWGALEHHPCLHFEACYYQAIEHAIGAGMARVEAGAQGEHKLARGYLPTATHSLHWVANESFSNAIAEYLEAERAAVDEEIEILTGYGPFRRTGEEADPQD
ncbi:GNAT family N-acetyltransferase [Poseidonocella sp. HB161398]|uniref:GNAT family N-acetyltransferase n=1 Tax=Poseidonocella sp. HB161398 TaxID=2320855 RepID=UPI0011096831